MKLKAIWFSPTNFDKDPWIPLWGNVKDIFVGKVKLLSSLEGSPSVRVAGLEFNAPSRQAIIRLVEHGGTNDGKPWKRLTADANPQPYHTADAFSISVPERSIFYWEDEPAKTTAQNQPSAAATSNGQHTVAGLAAGAQTATTNPPTAGADAVKVAESVKAPELDIEKPAKPISKGK